MARKWLYERKYTSDCDHIHVFPKDICMFMPNDFDNNDFDADNAIAIWAEPDGVRAQGEILSVLKRMFEEYQRRFQAEKRDE